MALIVPAARWRRAQAAECKVWLEGLGKDRCSDRQEEHADHFDGYRQLRGRHFSRIIEVGCGPFTNLRCILPELASHGELHLLDPLAHDYLEHDHCWYKTRTDVTLHASPLEDFTSERPFDLVICVNVLAHCRDAVACLLKIGQLLRGGGVLVFSEFVKQAKPDDVCHPVTLTPRLLHGFLGAFELTHRRLVRDRPQREDIYAIGRLLCESD